MRTKQVPSPLRNLRKARTLSQAQLAAAAGVTQQTLCKYERGTIVPPTDMQVRLATILGVPRRDVFPDAVEAIAS